MERHVWVIIKIHLLFCYYTIKRQISTKLIGENMFCMKAHQFSIVLPSKSRLVQLQIYTCYTKTCFFLDVTCYFSRITYFWSIVLLRCNDFIRFLYYFWTIPKTLIAQHYYTPTPQRGRGVFIPPLPEGGRGYTDLPLSICPSKIFFVAFFSVTVDGRNLIFGHKHHIGIPYWG